MRTILYSVSTGYFARNLLRTGVIEKLLVFPDIRIVIVTPGYDDEDFVGEFSFNERIFIEKMIEVKRDYDFLDTLIWKAWLLGHRFKYCRHLYKILLKIQLCKRYYSGFHAYYKTIFDKYAPDLVVGATPGVNSRRDLPVFMEAMTRKIKTLALIHSWDNIARRKGPMWIHPDILGVWNEFQKQDAIKNNFYHPENVIVVGPVHFDMYFRPETFMGRDAFFKKMRLDPSKKLISIIVTAEGLVRNGYIADILVEALKKQRFIQPVQLLCRPTPLLAITTDEYEQEFGRYQNNPDIVIDCQPQRSPVLGWNPTREQLYHFANLVQYTDVQVSIVSTATIEAAILDRPVVNVGFSTIQPERFQKLIIESVYNNHFKPVINYGSTYIAKDSEDLILGINNYLLDPGLQRKERKLLKEALLYKTDGKATERISRLILSLLP